MRIFGLIKKTWMMNGQMKETKSELWHRLRSNYQSIIDTIQLTLAVKRGKLRPNNKPAWRRLSILIVRNTGSTQARSSPNQGLSSVSSPILWHQSQLLMILLKIYLIQLSLLSRNSSLPPLLKSNSSNLAKSLQAPKTRRFCFPQKTENLNSRALTSTDWSKPNQQI